MKFPNVRNAARFTWNAIKADLGLGVGTPSPDSDFWYHRPGFRTAAGTYVSPETAMRLAAVFASVRVISETVGSLPLVIYRRRPDGGKERADQHPLYDVFQKPNLWQTGFEFWEMMQAHLELRGNAFAEIVSGNGRAIDMLVPLHPDRVRVFRLASGRLRYEVTNYFDGTISRVAQDEMFHLRALSSDGIIGMSTITAASEVVGTGLAQQEYRARFFNNKATPSMAVKGPKLSEEARDKLSNSISEGFSGANAFKVMVLPPGMEVQTLGLTNKDSQLIEASQATRTDIASMFRLPPHKIGDLTRGTFSNIEQQNIEFATDSIRPRVVRLERRIDLDLLNSLEIGAPGEFFAVFDMDALFRGDMKSRYEAYNTALQFWLTVNEVRAAEGKNPVEGGDEIMRPVNMQTAKASDEAADRAGEGGTGSENKDTLDNGAGDSGAEPTPDEDNQQAALVRAFAIRAADRVVRREVKGLRRVIGQKLSAEEFEKRLYELYGMPHFTADPAAPPAEGAFVAVMAETLMISLEQAQAYAKGHLLLISSAREDCLEAILDRIEVESGPTLAKLALGEKPWRRSGKRAARPGREKREIRAPYHRVL